MRGEAWNLEDQLFDLAREEVDPAKNNHVIAASGDASHAAVARSGTAWHEASQVMGAVANNWQSLLGQRGEYQLAMFAVTQNLAGVEGINDFRAEVVFPDVAAVFAFI
ncbi:hypothetical protein D3C74_399620 [compost metagenome]